MIHEEGKSASELSRKDEIFESDSGLISIAGGKLTGYRKMAERVIDMLISKVEDVSELRECITARISLEGGDFHSSNDVEEYAIIISKRLEALGLSSYSTYLIHLYGREVELILDHFETFKSGTVDENLGRAELWFCINYEMVQTPLDFFNRRTGMLYFDILRMIRIMDSLLIDFQRYFSWSDEQLIEEKSKLLDTIRTVQLK